MYKNTQKFRASIYVDIFIDYGENEDIKEYDLEKLREAARKKADELQDKIPNSYVGGIGTMQEIMQGIYENKDFI